MLITKIQRMRSRIPRYRVELDGSEGLVLSEEIVARGGLARGDEITAADVARLTREQERFEGRRIAVNYLSYRPRSSREVVQHLIRKGIGDVIAEEVTLKLRDLRMIDDAAFARMFVRDKLRKGNTGPLLLRQQLIVKGVARAEADLVLRELVPEQSQIVSAGRLVREYLRRRPGLMRLDALRRRQRLFAMLMRKGFSSETARNAVSQVKA